MEGASKPSSRQVPVLTVDKEYVAPGVVNGVMTFTIKIRNVGPTPLKVVPLTDTYEGVVGYVGAAPPEDSKALGVVRWVNLVERFGGTPLAPGAHFVVKTAFFLTTSTDHFSVTNTALVSGAEDIYGTPANEAWDSRARLTYSTSRPPGKRTRSSSAGLRRWRSTTTAST